MKTAVLLCALVVVVSARPDDKYTSKYDNTDYKQMMENPRLVNAYCDCVLEVGKCTADGKELKNNLIDALETHCSKCTDKQKEASRYIIKVLINKYPDLWKKLCDKYDPKGKFTAEYEKELKEL